MTTRDLIDRLAIVFVLVCASTGLVEAVRRDEPGLAALFALVAVGLVSIAVRRRSASTVEVRPDLHEWLETMSVVSGESSSDVADRAISSYRAGLGE